MSVNQLIEQLKEQYSRIGTLESQISQINSNFNKTISTANAAIERANKALAESNKAAAEANDAKRIALESAKTATNANTTATDANTTANNNKQEITKIWSPTVWEPIITNAFTRVSSPLRNISIQEASNAIQKTFADVSADIQSKINRSEFQDAIAKDAGIQDIRRRLGNTETKLANIPILTSGNVSTSTTTTTNTTTTSTLSTEITNLNRRVSEQERVNNTAITKLNDISSKIDNIPVTAAGLIVPFIPTAKVIENAAAAGTCKTTQPGGCLGNQFQNVQNRQNDILRRLDLGVQAGQGALLNQINSTVDTVNSKLGKQINGGLSGGLNRLSSFLGIDRIFNLLNFLAVLHNASMLSASLKTTLLETLSSVGNATGLLQTSEGDNIDLNAVFNQGIETFITSLIGVEAWASMKLTWRKYNSIYRAATNSLNAVSSMFNSIGQAVETGAEYTGKIGNAMRAAGLVREKAYNYMAEKFNVTSSNKYISFQSKIGNTTQVLETVNEIAENIVEGQQQYTEAVKATQDFHKQLSEAEKGSGVDNKAIKEEAEKIKKNLVKDPTGEDDQGLLSFLTDK